MYTTAAAGIKAGTAAQSSLLMGGMQIGVTPISRADFPRNTTFCAQQPVHYRLVKRWLREE